MPSTDMPAARSSKSSGVPGFRRKLLLAMMLVVVGLTATGLYLAERNLMDAVSRDVERRFEVEFAGLRRARDTRQSVLAGLGRTLARKPRIHAAFEDDALDLLYPSARDELREVMGAIDDTTARAGDRDMKATFCRFLDQRGAVIPPPSPVEMGELRAEDEAWLGLERLPDAEQIGYLLHPTPDGGTHVEEFQATPIISMETGQPIAALVVGFRSSELSGGRSRTELKTGMWLGGQLHFPGLTEVARGGLAGVMSRAFTSPDPGWSRLVTMIDSQSHLLLYRRLNPGSQYRPAYEVCAFSLADLESRQRELRWKILAAGGVMLLVGASASHYLARRFSVPVEKLAVASAENQKQRRRAEAALESTTAELQRTMRFSADASHQLNTPVTVLRAGLEELLERHELTPEIREEIADLVHQTYRLGGVIQDLLLLSRMDAGRVHLDLSPVRIKPLIEGWLDDLSTLPDSQDLHVETHVPDDLSVFGDRRYTTLILQNLLENARKYNRPGGRIRVSARVEESAARLTIGNTGSPIPPDAQALIFDRFHRGAMGENVPGCGLGLNLSRELARLHGGELRLACSRDDWTEFEVRFRLAEPLAIGSAAAS